MTEKRKGCYSLKTHQLQKLVMADQRRFRVIVAGRRWGKSQVSKIAIIRAAAGKQNQLVWYVAPTYQQARDIMWEDLKGSIPREWVVKINETRMAIRLINGSVIQLKGADKPDCYDDETEILTVDGWCKIAKLPPGLAVMTLNPETNTAEWQVPVRHIHEPYTGEMRRVSSDKLDLLVTPNHRFLVDTRKGARKFKTLDEIAHQDRIPASVNWEGDDDPALTEDWCAFLGFYLAEGCARKDPGPKKSYEITFAQTPGVKGGDKPDVRAEFIAVLKRLGLSYREHPDIIRVYGKDVWERVVHLGTAWEKRIPEEILNLPPHKLEVLLRWMVYGDGSMRRGRLEALYTTSKGMADDVQELCMKIGRAARVSEKAQTGGNLKCGRRIEAKRPLYQVSIFNAKHNYLRDTAGGSYISTESYSGMVHCVEVPNHTVYVRRNGKACWSGNSLRGVGLHFVVIDEAQDIKEETWEMVLQPTLATTNGRAVFIGTPKSFNWLYDRYNLGQRGDTVVDHRGRTVQNEWKSWQFPTISSPFIPKKEIEARRHDMDPKSFRQEFEASFLSMSGRVYYPFDRTVHVGDYPFNPKLPIYIGMDFNIDPMSSIVCQEQDNGDIWVVDEAVLYGSNVQETADELARRYFKHINQITIFPDPAGDNRSHNRGETSLDVLRDAGFKQIVFKRKHPLVQDRINSVNRLLRAADGTVRLRVNQTCRKFIESAEQTSYKEGTAEVDKKKSVEHAMDAFGYYADYRHPMRKRNLLGLSI